MSRDIRAFFKIESSKKRKPSNEPENSIPNKRAALKISDDEDEKKVVKKPKKRIIEDSSDEESSKLKKSSAKKQDVKKEVEIKDVKNLFGGRVKRTDRETKILPKETTSNGHHEEIVVLDVVDTPKKNDDEKEDISFNNSPSKPKSNGHQKAEVFKSPKKKEKESPKKAASPMKKSSTESPTKKLSKLSMDAKPLMKIVTNDKKPEVKKNKEVINDEWHVTTKPEKSEDRPSTSTSKPVQADKPKVIVAMTPIKRDVIPIDINTLSFVDKYKPTSVKEIIGQQSGGSNANKLQNWLLHWHKNHGDSKKKAAKFNPYAKNDDGSSFKAALLSGMPGIGKTTTVHLVCKELLFDVVEFNASDTRSKRLLKEEVQQLLSNKSLKGYASGERKAASNRHVLVMDEVDGMAGNEDRGGMAELIQLIKESHIPVICMCNDRASPKVRSLANHCFDLRFQKPTANQMRSAMMTICFKEGIKLEAGAIDSIISGTGNDIRQTLNHLALYSASKDQKIGAENAKKTAQLSEKDVKIGPWDVIRKVFSAEDHKSMSFEDKSDLFFYDYSIAPLFVQENYLHVKPRGDSLEVLEKIAKAADSISNGDLVDKKIRSNQAWSLLPTMAVFSSVIPGAHMEGNFTAPVNFPAWLGKNSNTNKRKRLAQEIHDHTRIATSGSRLSVRLDYAQFLVKAIVKPLIDKGAEGIQESLKVIKEYHLLREDLDSLFDLTTWGGAKSPWDKVDSRVKAALTRTYNKEILPYSFSAQADVKKKKKAASAEEEFGMEEDGAGQSDDDEEEDSIEKSTMIKVKKASAPKTKSVAGTSKKTTTKTAAKPSAKSKGKK